MRVHPKDNVIVALKDLKAGDVVAVDQEEYTVLEDINVKHKFAAEDLLSGDKIVMYGVIIGVATKPIHKGTRISVDNTTHETEHYEIKLNNEEWNGPDISRFKGRSFEGYHRKDGKVGTRNYWIVFPLVFCENRNIDAIEELMVEKLGYGISKEEDIDMDALISMHQLGLPIEHIQNADLIIPANQKKRRRVFENIDGIKFLKHDGGCGGIRHDSETLCRLLAGYVANPNVAGATVLSLGCQNAQFRILEEALSELNKEAGKPVIVLEQQKSKSERAFIADAIKQTFLGMVEANKITRKSAPLSKIVLGLECGGSDGFSGITANPALGHASDVLVKIGGTTMLAEFPELNGVEQELISRCNSEANARKFAQLMDTYNKRAKDLGSGFENNPSPGNIKDGLITDAMKSAGAAKKGGTSPVTSVLDYTEQANKPGLSLLCTPGNDVESTTGLAGSGANIIVFTTGLGTPTGNPIVPTIKFSSNTMLFERMGDIIDIDAGTIVSGNDTIESKGNELLELIIEIASGRQLTKAEVLGQNDFIPWKRGISL